MVRSSEPGRRPARLADAEVHDLRAAVLGQHDVARLQIAVDDARIVRDGQAVGDLAGDLDHARGLQPLPLDRAVERLTGDELHDDERPAVQLADVVDGDDIRVVEQGRQPGLTREALGRDVVRRQLVRHELDRDEPAQPRIARLVDLSHAAGPEGADDLVDADRWPGSRRIRCLFDAG